MKLSRFLILIFISIVPIFSFSAEKEGVDFVSPKDGDETQSKISLKFSVSGMDVKPAGVMSEKTGHHHLIVDGKPIPKGTPVPKDEKNLHFGKGESETTLTLPKGKHTLTLQFADGAHLSYGEAWSKTITITVK
ncbi:MAG: rod shape-determining protein RodA [Proteobacteria bacterium SG_bin7]|nr:MAG: rod shape-determining protein RodA [Proteobacteria bacterium SG_bin7]